MSNYFDANHRESEEVAAELAADKAVANSNVLALAADKAVSTLPYSALIIFWIAPSTLFTLVKL